MYSSDWPSKVAAIFLVMIFLGNDVIASTHAILNFSNHRSSKTSSFVLLYEHKTQDIDNIDVNAYDVAPTNDSSSPLLAPRNEMELAKSFARLLDFEVLDSSSSLRGYVSLDPDLIAAPTHILNVTRNAAYFRLDGNYNEPTPIAIGVDVSRLRSTSDLSNVQVFFLDRVSKTWKTAQTLGIDNDLFRVEAMVPAETDYFAGIISSPEMPEAAAFVPTSVSDIEPANPATGMRLMQPPSANRQGSAALSYPLWIPQGRNGMTPPLSVNYNSDAGTGWMGLGWNISQPVISVDTKWGVPEFDAEVETEPYVLNGEALFMQGNKRANRATLNSQGEVVPLPRVTTGSTRFFPRVMSSYIEIERKGTTPSNYYWVVTDGAQNKNYYGTIDGGSLDTNSVLKTSQGNIAQWYLSRTEDKWGNTIDYEYSLYEEGTTSNLKSGGINRVLKKITYTGFKGASYDNGKYSIEFFTSNNRGDASISLKMGLKHVDDRRLDSISVAFNNAEVVDYRFSYKCTKANFFKTVLTAIKEYRNDQFFYEHKFTYYEDSLKYGSGIELDTWNPSPWLTNSDAPSDFDKIINGFARLLQPSALKTSITSGFQVGADFGAGPSINKSQSKIGTFSGGLGWGTHWTNTQRTMRDVNGDGLPDVIYEDHSGNFAYYPVINRDGKLLLGGKRNFEIGGIQRSVSNRLNFHVDYMSDFGLYTGLNWSHTTSKSKRSMTDYNADGIPDMIIDEGSTTPRVHFGILEANGDISFSQSSEHTLNPVIKGVDFELENSDEFMEFQIVKTWEAPFSGVIEITGDATMSEDFEGSCSVAIQHNEQVISSGLQTVSSAERYSPRITREVEQGDILMFRVLPDEDGQQDFVEWDPNVTYGSTYPLDGNRSSWNSSSSSDGFLLSGNTGVQVLGRDSIKLDMNLAMIGTFSDDVFIEIQPYINGVAQTPLKDKLNPSNLNSLPNISNGISFLGNFGAPDDLPAYSATDTVTFTFTLKSTSNVNWSNIECRPVVTYFEDCLIGKKQYPLVKYQTYNNILIMEGDRNRPTDPSLFYEIYPQITLDTAAIADIYDGVTQDVDAIAYMTVKSGGNFLSRLAVHFFSDASNSSANSITLHPINETTGNIDFNTSLPWNAYQNNANVKFQGNQVVGSMLSVEFHVVGPKAEGIAEYINTNLFRLRMPRSSGTVLTVGGTTPSKNIYYHEFSELNTHHLGWGRFGWHPTSEEEILDIIPLADLHNSTLEAIRNEEVLPNDSLSMVQNGANYSIENEKFAILFPIRGETKWGLRTYQEELDQNGYLDRYSVYGTQMAEYQVLSGISPGFLGEEENELLDSSEPEEGINPSYTANGALDYSKSSSLSISISYSGVTGSAYLTDKDLFFSRAKRQFQDINGDGYPDVLDESNDLITIYPTNFFGSHMDGVQTLSLSEDNLNKSSSWGGTGSYSNNVSLTSPPYGGEHINETDEKFSIVYKESSIPIGGSLSLSNHRTRLTFIDINGDGLLDEYYDDQALWNGATPGFRLNAGAVMESNGITTSNRINSISYATSANTAFSSATVIQNWVRETISNSMEEKIVESMRSVKNKSWSLGGVLNNIQTKPKGIYLDLTGDGLVDYLEYSVLTDELTLFINQGGQFQEYDKIDDEPASDELFKTNEFGISIKGTGTGSFNPLGIKLKASITGNGDFSVNGLANSLMDMNGDGVPDYVEDTRGGKIMVYYAKFARNGKLRSVENPLGGTFEITYESEGQKNGYYAPQVRTHLSDETNEKMIWSMPHGKLVMNSVTIHDGLDVQISQDDLDGSDEFTTRFAYDGGVYSRREREFLGFSRVATISPSHWVDGVALLEDDCSHDGIEHARDVSGLYLPPEQSPDSTAVETLDRFNMSVVDFARLTDISQDEQFAFPYLSKLPETVYNLHVHEWMDTVQVRNISDSLLRVDTTFFQHIELISESNPDYEIRLVDTDPQSGTFGLVQTDGEDWATVTNLNSLGECATIFPAVTEVKKVSFPVVDDRSHYAPSKTNLEYDAYFNVVRVDDAGTGVATTPVEVIVDTMYYTHYVYRDQTNNCSIVSSLETVYDDGIMYGLLVPSAVAGYEDAVVFAYHPTTTCLPVGMPEVGICTGDDTEFTSVHRKEKTDTIFIKEIDYQATYSGNLIALLTYFTPGNSAQQTGVLKTHKIYQTNTNNSNLRRYSEVNSLQSATAPQVIRQHMSHTGTAYSESFVHYNDYGLVDSIVGPANHANKRCWSVYTYDTHNLGLVLSTRNHFGEITSNIYDFGLQLLEQTTDVNGHPMVYRYDDFSRLTSVWAPREVYTSTNGPTVSFQYFPNGINPASSNKNELVPVALTYHNTSNKGESVQFTNASTIDDYRTSLFTGGTNSMTSSVHTATFTNRQDAVVQVQTESDYDPSSAGTSKTTMLRVSGIGSVNAFGLSDVVRKDTLISSSTFGVFRPYGTWTIGTAEYDYALRQVTQESVWSDFDGTTSQDAYSLIGTSTTYEWLNGLTLNSGYQFTVKVESAGTSSRTYTDTRGRQVALKNGNDILTEFQYDPLGQLLKVKDPVGLETQYTYDNFGRTTQEIHPDRGTTQTTYDWANHVRKVDWEGDTITYEYNYNRLSKKIMPSGGSDPLYNVEYIYGASDGSNGANSVGRLLQIIQGNNANPFLIENYKYNEIGNIHSETKIIDIPNVGKRTYLTKYFYDSFGRTLRIQYPDNEQVRYKYSDLGALESITSQMPSEGINNIITDISYDGYGNINHILYGNGTENTFSYHTVTQGLMSNETKAKANVSSGFTVLNSRDYFYNNRGLISQVDFDVSPDLDAPVTGDYSFEYAYDDVNRLTQTKLFEGTSSTESYRLDMTYDEAGTIETKNSRLIGSGIITNNQLNYNAEYYPVNSTSHQIGEVGSFASYQEPGQPSYPDWGQRYSYNDQGSVEQIEEKNIATGTYSQDRVLVWNAEQQLVAVSMDNHTNIQHYVYDHTGTRMLKSSYTQSSLSINDTNVGNTSYMEPYLVYVNAYFVESDFVDGLQKTKHYYMGMQRVASDISLNEQIEEGMNKTSSTGSTVDATREESLSETSTAVKENAVLEHLKIVLKDQGVIEGADYSESELFAHNSMAELYPDYTSFSFQKAGSTGGDFTCCFNGDRYWYHPDYLGSVAMVTNNQGVAHQFFLYNAWGENMHTYNRTSQGFNSPYRFNGKEFDQETGLAYYGARYYDNKISMWLSVDPLAMSGKNMTMSPYQFTDNNPVMLVDPNGLNANPHEYDVDGTYLSDLGGDEVNFYHQEDGTTIIENAETCETQVIKDGVKNIRDASRRGEEVSWNDVYNEWKSGEGPEYSFFAPDHPGTVELSSDMSYISYRGREAVLNSDVDKEMVDVGFGGVFGILRSGFDCWEQMVGSAYISYYKIGDKVVYFISDVKSRTSFYYHFPGVKNRDRVPGEIIPESNTNQGYLWIESIEESKRRFQYYDSLYEPD